MEIVPRFLLTELIDLKIFPSTSQIAGNVYNHEKLELY